MFVAAPLLPNVFCAWVWLTAASLTRTTGEASATPVAAGLVVAATDVGMVTTSGATVTVWDGTGHSLRKLWSPGGRAPGAGVPRTRVRDVAAPGPTADSGWSVPTDPDDIEHQDDPRLVDEMGARAVRPGRPHAAEGANRWSVDAGGLVVVAAGGDRGWVGRGDGLWSVNLATAEANLALISAGGGVGAVGCSGDGLTVVAVDGTTVFRSRDGGATFEAVGQVAAPPRRIAATDGGDAVMVDEGHVTILRADGGLPTPVEIIKGADVMDVLACGGDILALGPSMLVRLSVRGAGAALAAVVAADRIALPGAVDRLACGAAGGPWWARGDGLWTSADRGVTWTAMPDLAAGRRGALAANRWGAWITTPAGLLRVSSAGRVTKSRLPAPRTGAGSAWGAGQSPPTWRWWHRGLPRVDLSFTTARTTTRQDVAGFLMATFALDGPGPGALRAVALARELARRRGAAARPAGHGAVAMNAGPDDDVDVEERLACLRILEERP